MAKVKLFIDNFLVYGFGGIISKIIPLVMLPIITRLMPDSGYFGISDMSNTLVTFCSYFAIMGMYDAMYRMFFDSEDELYKKKVCSTAMLFTIGTSIFVFGVMIFFRSSIASFVFDNKKYAYVVYISAMATLVGATNSIVSAPTRMQNKRNIFLVTNTVGPILSYSVSIPLLLAGYYVIALPLAGVISALSMELVFWILNRKWFSIEYLDLKLLKKLVLFAVPLLPNMLVYWIFNSSDRVMITRMLGIGEAGIYAIGSKLGLASQLIYTAFAGGWQFFAFSTMKDKDQVKSNSNIFEYLGLISFFCTLVICILAKPIYDIVFTIEYKRAYIISPYLFLAPLLQMLFQVAGNQFLVVKITWPPMILLSFGVVVNIVFNLKMIPLIGIEGAAIATVSGYIVSVVMCVIVLSKMKLFVIKMRIILVSALTFVSMAIWRLLIKDSLVMEIIMIFIWCSLVALLYRKDINRIAGIISRRQE